MKITLIAATLFGLATLPAFAGEGGREPFPLVTPGITTATRVLTADVGSAQYPDFAGRPGSALGGLVNAVLAETGNETPVQTANSLPTGFTDNMPAYAQATPAVPAASMTASLQRSPRG